MRHDSEKVHHLWWTAQYEDEDKQISILILGNL